ncbi:cytochrome C oxidase subunit IV family protein [Paraconexibacter sp.]|uniref:cytochrome C oxidase subunit IV family protein n=1 Tax=Paraconexibacter sp. TaxID=2949640 RepID=UPI003569C735
MRRQIFRTDVVSAAWAALVLATGVSWWLGADHGLGAGDAAVAGVLAIGFAKAWVVGRWFMDLRAAPLWLRRCFDAWVGGSGIAVCVLSLAI